MNPEQQKSPLEYASLEVKEKPKAKFLRGTEKYFDLREGKENEPNKPFYSMLNLDIGCSYKCFKCAIDCPLQEKREKDKILEFEEIKNLFKLLEESDIKTLVIIGDGEPTENFDEATRLPQHQNYKHLVKPILEEAYKNKLTTIMFTTLSQLNEKQAEFYRDHDVSIFVSLDSLDPKKYKKITGGGDLFKVLENIKLLRKVYAPTQEIINGESTVRLGINTTVTRQNLEELEKIKELAGSDFQFIANSPMKRGRFKKENKWKILVGDDYQKLEEEAKNISETGGHSSIKEGVCRYLDGIGIDSDGAIFSGCNYMSETAGFLGNIRDYKTVEKINGVYKIKKEGLNQLTKRLGTPPSCPARSEHYDLYVEILKSLDK